MRVNLPILQIYGTSVVTSSRGHIGKKQKTRQTSNRGAVIEVYWRAKAKDLFSLDL
jgi:hypothetical protein